MREHNIQRLVWTHPKLFGIDDGYQFVGFNEEYQYPDKTRPDALFRDYSGMRSVVAEIKDDPLRQSDLEQLIGYLEWEQYEVPSHEVRGLLIGMISNNLDEIEETASKYPVPTTVMCMHRDYHMTVKICEECNQAYWPSWRRCPFCRGTHATLSHFHTGRA